MHRRMLTTILLCLCICTVIPGSNLSRVTGNMHREIRPGDPRPEDAGQPAPKLGSTDRDLRGCVTAVSKDSITIAPDRKGSWRVIDRSNGKAVGLVLVEDLPGGPPKPFPVNAILK